MQTYGNECDQHDKDTYGELEEHLDNFRNFFDAETIVSPNIKLWLQCRWLHVNHTYVEFFAEDISRF